MLRLTRSLAWAVISACLSLLAAAPARAATVEVCLRVDPLQIPAGQLGNAAPIAMWSFIQTGLGAGCTFTSPAPAATATSVPVPTLTASVGDTLVVHLFNNLPAAPSVAYTEPVSVIIPGQPGVLVPTWTDGTTGNRQSPAQRVRSFTAEAPQQGSATYTFGPLQAGTYLLQSGTHPAVQLQMGLYGVLQVYQTAPVAPATGGQGYADASSAFDREATLLLSEIDPVLHAAVAAGQYGPSPAPPPGWLTSTIDYHPRFFLVNGRPFTAGAPPIPVGAAGKRVLLRFLNAGLATKVPEILGAYVSILAEDGHFFSVTGPGAQGPRPAPRQQYTVLLPAGKTVDALLTTPASPACIPIYDRRLDLTNSGASPGGVLVFLSTRAVPGACP